MWEAPQVYEGDCTGRGWAGGPTVIQECKWWHEYGEQSTGGGTVPTGV